MLYNYILYLNAACRERRFETTQDIEHDFRRGSFTEDTDLDACYRFAELVGREDYLEDSATVDDYIELFENVDWGDGSIIPLYLARTDGTRTILDQGYRTIDEWKNAGVEVDNAMEVVKMSDTLAYLQSIKSPDATISQQELEDLAEQLANKISISLYLGDLQPGDSARAIIEQAIEDGALEDFENNQYYNQILDKLQPDKFTVPLDDLDEELTVDREYFIDTKPVDKDDFYNTLVAKNPSDQQMLDLEHGKDLLIAGKKYKINKDSQLDKNMDEDLCLSITDFLN